jgi:hypothetical protein
MDEPAVEDMPAPPQRRGPKKTTNLQPTLPSEPTPAAKQTTKPGRKRKKTVTTPVNSPEYEDGPNPPRKGHTEQASTQAEEDCWAQASAVTSGCMWLY